MSFSLTELPAGHLEGSSVEEVLEWAFDRFGSEIALGSSFGLEDVALIHMATTVRSDLRIFTLDTGRLHQATYDVMDRIRNRYGVEIEVLFPQSARVEAMVRTKGVNLFYDSVENRRQCCFVRKVEPLKRYLAKLNAWITGLRRDQNVTRSLLQTVEIDAANGGIAKINPLADWSFEKVLQYVKDHRVPYSSLHDEGYPSVGCEPCTRAIKTGDDPRSGRWWWETTEARECGLHRNV